MFKSLLAVCLMASAVVAQEVRLSSSSDVLFALPQQNNSSTVLDVPTKAPVPTLANPLVTGPMITVEDQPMTSILGEVDSVVWHDANVVVSNETCVNGNCAVTVSQPVARPVRHHSRTVVRQRVFSNAPVRTFFRRGPIRSRVCGIFGCR